MTASLLARCGSAGALVVSDCDRALRTGCWRGRLTGLSRPLALKADRAGGHCRFLGSTSLSLASVGVGGDCVGSIFLTSWLALSNACG